MIESGSASTGVAVRDFGLPPGIALRYEQADPVLRPFLPAYAALDSDEAYRNTATSLSWGLPSWALIWIVLTKSPIAVRIGNRRYEPLGSAMLCGVTSRAMPTEPNGGLSIVMEVSSLGWARLFGASAADLSDRFTPLDQLLPREWIDELIAELAASDDARDLKAICDRFWLRHLPPPQPDEALVARVADLLADPASDDLAERAAAVGIDARTLRRVTKRYFGFPPKLLLIRARFLRALVPMMLGEADPRDIPPVYHDRSHFNRDARRLLGMTARRFVAIPNAYIRAVLRARRLVIGSAAPALDRVGAASQGQDATRAA